MKKRMTMIVALLLSVSLLAACGGSALAASPVVMKFANDDSSTSTYHFGLLEFERLVEEASKGAIDVQVFSDAVLGTSKDMLEGLQYGTLEAAFVVTSAMSNFVPEYSLLDGPFIFRDAAHAQKVADSKEIGEWLNGLMLERTNIRVMGYMDSESRNIYSTKPVRSLADFKGLKIRSMTNEISVALFEALGALPTPMASGEIFTALQQGTIDASENNIAYVRNQKHYENTKYVTLSRHLDSLCAIMVAEPFFQTLSPEHQAIVLDAGKKACIFQREMMKKQNVEAKEWLEKEQGVEFIEIDVAPLKEACKSVYTNFPHLLDPEKVKLIDAM